jgi:serine/threonine-protein phosphatase 2A regulatory subunit B'
MVYSAMKLFMEINPSLFDECTNDYAALQESAPARNAERESIWKALEEKADSKRKLRGAAADPTARPRTGSPMQISDDSASDSQKKMDALHLQDESPNKAVGYA